MPRFVILEHDFPSLHWDFMLESGNVLRTWRLASPPAPGQSICAEALADHRLLYLDYEGPLSGNRGQVRRWEGGTFAWVSRETDEQLSFVLEGPRLHGQAQLVRDRAGEWQFRLE